MMQNANDVSKFYDVVWTEYIPEYRESEQHLELFFENDEIIGKDILDSGCGTGIFSTIFAAKGAKKVTGIDISEGSLSTAMMLKERYGLKNLQFYKQNMLDLPFTDNRFDIVWAWGTVHHTSDPLKAINELIRVLNNNGTILLAVYKKTWLTPVHETIRKICIRLPKSTWIPLSKVMAVVLTPAVYLFKKREKLRKGEFLDELILDWYFVPIRFHYTPEEIKIYLEEKGFIIEKYIPASGRFDSTSNFIYKAKKKIRGADAK
jgi:2-polyprenyl-6-hydroxyphenyl methylase / 3-demethylubiquinone-9 3-methyltransferase